MTETLAEDDCVIYHDPSFRWEDIVVGQTLHSGTYAVTEQQIIAHARRYDPLPIHIDLAFAALGPFGAITAPGSLILAVRARLMNDFAFPGGVIACAGFDEVRFIAPLKAQQNCIVAVEFLEKRPSASRSDRGIAVLGITLLAEHRPILTMKETILLYRRAEQA